MGKIKINVVQRTVELGMLPRLFCLKMVRMRGIYGVAQLARWRLTLISVRANQRSNLVDVSSACRGELQRRGGPTGMCNTARLPSSPFNLSLFLSLSLSPPFSLSLFRSYALHATSSNLYFRLDRELVEARGPLFYRPIQRF